MWRLVMWICEYTNSEGFKQICMQSGSHRILEVKGKKSWEDQCKPLDYADLPAFWNFHVDEKNFGKKKNFKHFEKFHIRELGGKSYNEVV